MAPKPTLEKSMAQLNKPELICLAGLAWIDVPDWALVAQLVCLIKAQFGCLKAEKFMYPKFVKIFPPPSEEDDKDKDTNNKEPWGRIQLLPPTRSAEPENLAGLGLDKEERPPSKLASTPTHRHCSAQTGMVRI
jgi:hypothetical protein